jgi:hypothetical protein
LDFVPWTALLPALGLVLALVGILYQRQGQEQRSRLETGTQLANLITDETKQRGRAIEQVYEHILAETRARHAFETNILVHYVRVDHLNDALTSALRPLEAEIRHLRENLQRVERNGDKGG